MKRWDTSQKCLEANSNQIQVNTINNNFCEEENVSSEPALEMGMFYTKEQIFSMSVIWEYISIINCKVKMQVDTGADSTVISTKKGLSLVNLS